MYCIFNYIFESITLKIRKILNCNFGYFCRFLGKSILFCWFSVIKQATLFEQSYINPSLCS